MFVVKKSFNMKLFFSVLLVLMPILQLYGFVQLPFVTFSEYAVILFVVMVLIKDRALVFDSSFIPIMAYLLVQPLILRFYVDKTLDWVDAAGTAWKLALYIFVICFITKKYLKKEYFVKAIRIIGVFSSIYGIAQFVLGTFFKISLSPYWPLLPVIRTSILDTQNEWISYGWIVRARSIFSEPSTFSIFLLLAVMVELLMAEKDKYSWWRCILYTIGIFVSTSSTGTVGLALILIAYIIMYPGVLTRKIPKKLLCMILFLLPVGVLILIRSGYIEYFWNHLFANGQGLSSQSHFADVEEIIQMQSSWQEIIFGHGMQDAGGYLPGWIATYYGIGIIGIILYAIGFFKIYFKAAKNFRIYVAVFIILNIGTEIMLGVYLVLYLAPILISLTDRENSKNCI